MEPLLYVVHRIPYPPNKGDKIRSFNILKHLSQQFDVYLGTFIDDPADRESIEPLQEYCRVIKAIEINPLRRKIASLSALISGRCLTVPYYANDEMQQWVSQVVSANHITHALVFSSPMAQFLDHIAFEPLTRVIDFVDVDSEKWRAYATKKKWPANWVYGREARTLLDYEKQIANKFNYSLFVSGAEATLFKSISGLEDDRIKALHNGVDLAYFDSSIEHKNPYPRSAPTLVFTGAMDYWANADAVCWFAKGVFVRIKENVPDAEFWIVGSKPSDSVLKLDKLSGVVVTGAVDDVRPYLQHATAAVAPLRLARGIQNKVLEAMAMSKIVVATPQAAEGIDFADDYESLITGNADDMADACTAILTTDRYTALGSIGCDYVRRYHRWSSQLGMIDGLFGTRVV